MIANAHPIPNVNHPDFAPFWRGTANGELCTPVCSSCGTRSWPPRMACPECRCLQFEWSAIGNVGRVYSWTEIGVATLPGFEEDIPYVVLAVEAGSDPNIRFLGRLVDGWSTPSIGTEVAAVFRPFKGGFLVDWRPTSEL